ncbi:MAG: IS66 family insertion sequence element accessory protein TnpB [Firmicutes bacterium]|nr:IS66 family insertion sequence element accessory protein TnpB [Bacillota bacterium]
MDKITNVKNEFRLKQWAKIIQSCQESNMTVVAWCAQNNVNIKSYYYWLRKLRTLACESGQLMTNHSEQQIVPLTFERAKTSSEAAITIHLSDISIDINNGASRTTIEAVLSSLKNIC